MRLRNIRITAAEFSYRIMAVSFKCDVIISDSARAANVVSNLRHVNSLIPRAVICYYYIVNGN